MQRPIRIAMMGRHNDEQIIQPNPQTLRGRRVKTSLLINQHQCSSVAACLAGREQRQRRGARAIAAKPLD
jgi:hypothetical protein